MYRNIIDQVMLKAIKRNRLLSIMNSFRYLLKFISSMAALISSIRVLVRSRFTLLIRMAKNRKQKAIKVTIKEVCIGRDMLKPRLVIITGWIVRHNLMEKKVIGTLTKPIIPKTADRLAR